MPDLPDLPEAAEVDAAGAVAHAPGAPGAPAAGRLTEESVTTTLTVTTSTAAGDEDAPRLTAVQLALQAGWTMAVLYGQLPGAAAGGAELATVNELHRGERRALEASRLRHLLRRLGRLPELAGADLPHGPPPGDPSPEDLASLHLALLTALAGAGLELQLAYELGRALRDTASPPGQQPGQDPGQQPGQNPRQQPGQDLRAALAAQLAHPRIARLQEWLGALSGHFPPHAAAVVSASAGRWSDLAAVTLGAAGRRPRLKRGQEDIAAKLRDYLLPQGDVWLMLLMGARPAAGLLTPEGYVAAGEEALRRSAAIARQVIRHYWAALAVAAAALGGVLYLAITYLGGAAKVWTVIAAIGGWLGVSVRSIGAAAGRLAAEAERPVFAMAEDDVMAWAITTAPPGVRLTYRGVRLLRRSGIAPTARLGRV